MANRRCNRIVGRMVSPACSNPRMDCIRRFSAVAGSSSTTSPRARIDQIDFSIPWMPLRQWFDSEPWGAEAQGSIARGEDPGVQSPVAPSSRVHLHRHGPPGPCRFFHR
jgi:hypothetical protein